MPPALRKVHVLGFLYLKKIQRIKVSVLLRVTCVVRVWGRHPGTVASHNCDLLVTGVEGVPGTRASAFLANFRVSVSYKKEPPLSS